MTQGLKTKPILFALSAGAMALGAASLALPLGAQDLYRNKIDNDMRQCAPGGGPAVRVTVQGVKNGSGVVRVQSYRGTKADWLEKGRWLNRIEAPARSGTMYFCMPVPETGNYGIAVRHDVNGNGKTDLSEDGGGMSNNPSINIFNLGKPSYTKTTFEVGAGVTTIRVQMKYM